MKRVQTVLQNLHLVIISFSNGFADLGFDFDP